jgi:low temperature requirement protein LtrA
MVAVADRVLIAEPNRALTAGGITMTVGGSAVYLLGESAVRLHMIRSISPQRLLVVAVLGLLGGIGRDLSALALSATVAATLIALAAWEHERFRPQSGPFAWIRLGDGSEPTPDD